MSNTPVSQPEGRPAVGPPSLAREGLVSSTGTAPGRPAWPVRHGGFVLRPARDDERYDALKHILSQSGQLADDARVVDFLRYAVARRIDLTRLHVVEQARPGTSDRAGAIVWAILPIPSPGRTALILSPSQLPPGARSACSELIDLALADMAELHLAQALVDPVVSQAEQPFLDVGFQRLATLQYLQRDITSAPVRARPPGNLHEVHYSPETHGLFCRAIELSYQDSLDCPALTGQREIDDVVAGHQATGDFSPELWIVLVAGPESAPSHTGAGAIASGPPEPAAVLILSPTGNGDTMELVYLGVSPQYRRQGLGHWAVREAMQLTFQAGLPTLTLAVDAHNRPALKLYHRFGFRKVHERNALYRDPRAPRYRPVGN